MRFEFQNLSGEPTPHKRRRFGSGAGGKDAVPITPAGGAALTNEDGDVLTNEDGLVVTFDQ